MRAIARSLTLLALLSPLLVSCQKQQAPKPGAAAPLESKPSAASATRAIWKKEKAEIFAAVSKCSLAPAEAIQQLTRRRDELAPSVKDGKPFGFNPARVKQLARKGGCAEV